MKECTFCNIIKGKIESNIVYENQWICCFMDMDPIDEGHILVVPKKHYLDIDELDDKTGVEIIKGCKLIVQALKKSFNPDGYSIMHNGGEFDDVGHYHMHVFPRFKNDGFNWVNEEINIKTIDELQKTQEVIKKSIDELKQ